MPHFRHRRLTVHEASAMKELEVLDNLRAGLLAASVSAHHNKVQIDYLHLIAGFIAKRREGLMSVLDGAGVMYAPTPAGGEVRPQGFKAIKERG